MERYFRTKEIASKLNVDKRTVKRWCQFLEGQGYKFLQDSIGRKFEEKELKLFYKFEEYTKRGKMKAMDAAIQIVKERYSTEIYLEKYEKNKKIDANFKEEKLRTTDISKQLNISVGILNSWMTHLIKEGFVFKKDSRGRYFEKNDFEVFKNFKRMTYSKKIKASEVAKKIAKRKETEEENYVYQKDDEKKMNEKIKILEYQIDKLVEENTNLQKELLYLKYTINELSIISKKRSEEGEW